MATLHGLIVGINKFENKDLGYLEDAVPNARKIKYYLDQHRSRYTKKLKILEDYDAKRCKIIEAFEKMAEDAKSGDICLFYFAGHGSLEKAPRELYQKKGITNFETIICSDSRSSDFELVDKEIAHLISKVIGNKDVHFTAIMDCCHAGGNTRDDKIQDYLIRAVSPNKKSRHPNQFYEFEKWDLNDSTPNHIAIAACRSDQTAFDGVFTPRLIDLLKENGDITYTHLLSNLKKKLKDFWNQTPGLYPDGDNNPYKDDLFLKGAFS